MISIKAFGIIIFFSSVVLSAVSQVLLPTPSSKDQLFYLQRSTNTNTVIYDLNYKEGVIDTKYPVRPYWILYEQKGRQENLNYLQRKYAYGLKTNKISDNHYELSFVAYDKFKMHLEPGADNKLHVYSTINNKKAILTRIFLKINGGTFWFPNIEYFELVGIDPSNNSILKERLKI